MKRGMLPFFLDEVFDDFHHLVPTTADGKMIQSDVSISEDEEHVYVRAHVPGIKPDQIHVTFEKGVLWIKAEAQEEEKGEKYLYKASTSFSHRIPVPIPVDEQSSPQAVCKNGVLKISFLKSRASRPMKISIKEE